MYNKVGQGFNDFMVNPVRFVRGYSNPLPASQGEGRLGVNISQEAVLAGMAQIAFGHVENL